MPLPVENLQKGSSDEAIKKAISASIAICNKEGKYDQDQCAAMAYGIARRKTGKRLGK